MFRTESKENKYPFLLGIAFILLCLAITVDAEVVNNGLNFTDDVLSGGMVGNDCSGGIEYGCSTVTVPINEEDEDEGEFVYMINGVAMRELHIEGEDLQYLVDPQGLVYDMQANFIGTAIYEDLEESGAEQDES